MVPHLWWSKHQNAHMKSSTAMSLSRDHDPVAQDYPQIWLWAVFKDFFGGWGGYCPFKNESNDCDVKGVGCSNEPQIITQRTGQCLSALQGLLTHLVTHTCLVYRQYTQPCTKQETNWAQVRLDIEPRLTEWPQMLQLLPLFAEGNKFCHIPLRHGAQKQNVR